MLLRAYTYRCERCGELFDDEDLAEDAELIEESIYIYTIPDADEFERLIKKARSEDVSVLTHGKNETTWHECKNKGIGIARVVGCSEAYEIDVSDTGD